MSKNFINFHVLISHSPSCLNRDDMNMQKSAIFGGVRRVRVSSQSLKRSMRKSDYYTQHLGQPSERTRELGAVKKKFAAALKDRYPEELVDTAIELVSGKTGIVEDTRADAVAPWAVKEVAHFCQAIQDAGDDVDAKKLAKQIRKDATPFNEAIGHAVDIALSGRMATSGLMTNIDGALAVAHAITTHAVDADIDWFTAVDDLIEEEKEHRRIGETEEGKGELGAGHLNTQEFSAGVFYRYASLNIRQLQNNLGGASRGRVLEIAAHTLHLLATVVPPAKQQTFAAHNLADYAMVSFNDIPISLANAFEKPMRINKREGFLSQSIDAMHNYWKNVHQGYGLEESVAAFQLGAEDRAGEPQVFNALLDLKEWVQKDGEIDI